MRTGRGSFPAPPTSAQRWPRKWSGTHGLKQASVLLPDKGCAGQPRTQIQHQRPPAAWPGRIRDEEVKVNQSNGRGRRFQNGPETGTEFGHSRFPAAAALAGERK
jgi:hypothetical protein